MAHILNKITNVPIEILKNQLNKDAKEHALHDMYLEHIWQNDDNKDEVIFLFKTKNLSKAKKYIHSMHTKVKKENPTLTLPETIFLQN